MAAYAALTSLMTVVDDIENHHSPPISLDKQQVESLTEIVTSLQEFLDVYNSPLADDEEADPLEMRIADAAYAVEDVIETHIVDTIEQKKSIDEETSSICSEKSCFSGCFRFPKKSEYVEGNYDIEQINRTKFHHDLQQVIEQMDEIKKVAMETETDRRRRNAVSSSDTTLTSSSSTTMVCSQQVIEQMDEMKKVAMETETDRRRRNAVSSSGTTLTSSSSSSTTMVCSDGVLLGMLDKLTGGQRNLQAISIVGMGGIGKTTLARNIYAHSLIKHHFDICAWATISQQYDTREILREVLSQATDTGKEEDKLGLELHKYLYGRRFLIVLDDMWSIHAWEKIQLYLPNNENGSRVLVTTRLTQLSSQLNENCSLQMEFLDEVSSWDLFSKIVFGDGSCPPKLKKIAKKIVDNCKGLPLSIVVVGGLLKKMDHTPEYWESINNNLASTVNLENDKHCLRLLKMSYNHLPNYLKPCFLYMGVFEEDDRIKVSTLVKLWVSEGFLKAKNNESLKTIAREFLKELVDRNLILVEVLEYGKIMYCKVHDLLRDLCLTEAHKNRFYHVIELGSYRGISSPRRIVIRRNTPKIKVLKDLNSMPHARSIICEYGNFPSCRNLRLLRILHAYHGLRYFKNKGLRSYMNFLVSRNVNLRHLAFGGSIKSSFFSSLNSVWNFQTLITYNSSSTVPVEIWKMAQIKHIEFVLGRFYLRNLPSDMNDVVIMKNLDTLKGVKNFKCSEEMVKRIPNIKRLGVNYNKLTKGDDYYFSNIILLSKLESLSVSMKCKHTQAAAHMQNLIFPNSLKSLALYMTSDFEWEEMLQKIAWLPFLQNLQIENGCFATGKWQLVEGQFPSLKLLELYFCVGLKQWTVEDSHVLPHLERLHLYLLQKLEGIPREIGDIPTLHRLLLYCCSISAVESAKEMVDEQVEMQGEGLSFHVEVWLRRKDKALHSLASPNFIVRP